MKFSRDPHHPFTNRRLALRHAPPPTHPARRRLAGRALAAAGRTGRADRLRRAGDLRVHRRLLARSADGRLRGGETPAAHRAHARLQWVVKRTSRPAARHRPRLPPVAARLAHLVRAGRLDPRLARAGYVFPGVERPAARLAGGEKRARRLPRRAHRVHRIRRHHRESPPPPPARGQGPHSGRRHRHPARLARLARRQRVSRRAILVDPAAVLRHPHHQGRVPPRPSAARKFLRHRLACHRQNQRRPRPARALRHPRFPAHPDSPRHPQQPPNHQTTPRP